MKSLLTLRGWLVICSLAIFLTLSANSQTGAWTWRSGSNLVNAPGDYAAYQSPSPSNVPGARLYSATWTDSNGNLWLFGGNGIDGSSNSGVLNDLWEFSVSSQQWIWQGGSPTVNATGNYGSQGVPNINNYPGARSSGAFAKDSAGNFWIFGGYGFDKNGNEGLLGDLWKFNPNTLLWTWMGGSQVYNNLSYEGPMGVGSAIYYPSARVESALWIDPSGNAWVFGGEDAWATYFYNDVWEFTPSNNSWTWQQGSVSSSNLPPVYTSGNPADITPGGESRSASWTDSSGNFWLITGTTSTLQFNSLWKYTSATNLWSLQNSSTYTNAAGVYGTEGAYAPANILGARAETSYAADSSGNLWIFAGWGCNSLCTGGNAKLNDLLLMNGSTMEWEWEGGSDTLWNLNGVYGTPNQTAFSSYPGGRYGANGWVDNNGSFWTFGGVGVDSVGNYDLLNDLWQFQFATATPVITPGSETFYTPVTVTITDATPGATIYYTTDGSTPVTSPTTLTYSGPFTVSSTSTVNAVAAFGSLANSQQASTTYTMGNFFWGPTTTTFIYGTALGGVPGLLSASSSLPGNVNYFISGYPVNAATVLNAGQYQLDAIFTSPSNVQLDKISYKITVKPASLFVTPNPVTVTYGSQVVKYTYSITGFVNGDPSTVVSGVPSINATATSKATVSNGVVYTSNIGNYTIKTTWGSLKAANYTFIFQTAPLTINPCACTLTVVPYSAVITQGSPIPSSFSYKVIGFINFDNAANQLTGTATTWTNAVNGSPHGYYTIYSGPGTLNQLYNNYGGINFGTATLTIH